MRTTAVREGDHYIIRGAKRFILHARNADFIVEADAGVVVPNSEFDGPRLLAEALPLLTDPQRLTGMRERLAGLVPRDAAADLARLVLEQAGA